MTKILLTNPTLENERDVTDPLLPLGMISVASYLRKHIDDEMKFQYVNHDFPETFKRVQPDMVFMTTMSPYYHKARKVARQFKELDPSVPIVVGGYHISILPKTLTEDMDVGIIGEGEITAKELYPHIGDPPPKTIKGLVYRDKGKTVITEPRPIIRNLDMLPLPARDIMKDYVDRSQFTSMLTARGCPFHCAFCANSAFWGGIRFFSAEYVVKEIEHLVENYTSRIAIVDDSLTINKPRLKKIADLIEERGIDVEVRGNGRAELIDEEMCRLMKRIGITNLCFGLESGNQRTLSYLKEDRITVEDNWRALKLCDKYDIFTTASTVLFSPDETREEVYDTYEMLKNPLVKYAVANILVPLPGTPVWKEALERGLVKETAEWDWGKLTFAFPYYSKEDFYNLVVMSKHFSIDEMYEIWLDFKKLTEEKTVKYQIKDGIRHPLKAFRYFWRRVKWRILKE